MAEGKLWREKTLQKNRSNAYNLATQTVPSFYEETANIRSECWCHHNFTFQLLMNESVIDRYVHDSLLQRHCCSTFSHLSFYILSCCITDGWSMLHFWTDVSSFELSFCSTAFSSPRSSGETHLTSERDSLVLHLDRRSRYIEDKIEVTISAIRMIIILLVYHGCCFLSSIVA